MKQILVFALLLMGMHCTAQTETYDVFTYTAPAGRWKKETGDSYTSYTSSDAQTKKWCRVALYKSAASKGNIEQDFLADWQELAANTYKITAPPVTGAVQQLNGWKLKSGKGSFIFDKNNATVQVTTYSNGINRVTLVSLTNSTDYSAGIQNLAASIQLPGAAMPAAPKNNNTPAVVTQPIASGFAFNSTNFDDGWVSTIQADWVEVTKGSIKVLLHYPKEGTIFPADPDPLTRAAWDVLVAPHYATLTNFKTTYITSYNRAYLASGNVTDKSGKPFYVALFRRGGGWTEFIAPDKAAFIQQFGADIDAIRWDSDTEILEPMEKMPSYNKFAVAAADLKGTGEWTDRFSSNTYYANSYTGASAGMSTYSSTQWFNFGAGQSYKWQLVAANTYGGNTQFAQAKGAGTFKSLNNWQLHFTNIEGKAKTYDVYFTATRGGRVLWMNDAQYPGSGIFTGYVKGK